MTAFKAFWGGKTTIDTGTQSDANRLKRKSSNSPSLRASRDSSKRAKKTKARRISNFFERKSKAPAIETSDDNDDWVLIDEGENLASQVQPRRRPSNGGYYSGSHRSRSSKGSGRFGSRRRKRGWMCFGTDSKRTSSDGTPSRRGTPTPTTLQLRGTRSSRHDMTASQAFLRQLVDLWDENGVVRADAFQGTERTTKEVKRTQVPFIEDQEQHVVVIGEEGQSAGLTSDDIASNIRDSQAIETVTPDDGNILTPPANSILSLRSVPRRLKTSRKSTISKGKASKLDYDLVQKDTTISQVDISPKIPRVKAKKQPIGGSSLAISHFLSRLRKRQGPEDNDEVYTSIVKPNVNTTTSDPFIPDKPSERVVDIPIVKAANGNNGISHSAPTALDDPKRQDTSSPKQMQDTLQTEAIPEMTNSLASISDAISPLDQIQSPPVPSEPVDPDLPGNTNPTTVSKFLKLLKNEQAMEQTKDDVGHPNGTTADFDEFVPPPNVKDPTISQFLQELKQEAAEPGKVQQK